MAIIMLQKRDLKQKKGRRDFKAYDPSKALVNDLCDAIAKSIE